MYITKLTLNMVNKIPVINFEMEIEMSAIKKRSHSA